MDDLFAKLDQFLALATLDAIRAALPPPGPAKATKIKRRPKP